jgi:small subunit ribosomal protein S19
MRKSLKKGPFVARDLLEKIGRINRDAEKQAIRTWSRSSTIVPIIIGHTISVHNGQEHFPIFIGDQIVGNKLGEFAPTRTYRGHIKSDKKIKHLTLFYFYGTKKFIRLEFVWELLDDPALSGTQKSQSTLFFLKKINTFVL